MTEKKPAEAPKNQQPKSEGGAKPRSKKRPQGGRPSGPRKAPAAAEFKDSLLSSLGDDFAQKLKRHVEDNIKRRIKEAQNDPAVQKASQKYGSN